MKIRKSALKTREKGSALVYILVAIALLATLTSTFMDSSNQQASSQQSVDITSDLKAQIEFIRSAIQECVISYPKGDTSMPANPVGGHNPIRPYPLMPQNPYLSSPTATNLLKDIRCPGDPGNSNNHQRIFSQAKGKFLPARPKMFDEWYYQNDTYGVFIYIGTSRTDAALTSALERLDAQYARCETQFINNTANGSAVDICPANYKCFKVHLVTSPTTAYPGETGCPS